MNITILSNVQQTMVRRLTACIEIVGDKDNIGFEVLPWSDNVTKPLTDYLHDSYDEVEFDKLVVQAIAHLESALESGYIENDRFTQDILDVLDVEFKRLEAIAYLRS